MKQVLKHIPNAITCCNLISGCIAIMWATRGDFRLALLFIVIGAVFDFFDGMSARLLHVSSPIGKELDSLADLISFGLCPSVCLFSWYGIAHPEIPLVRWFPFLLTAASALRLAKFNLDERQAMGFIGLPTPANALFWGSIMTGATRFIESSPWMSVAVVVMVFISSWLLVCEIPMFALKFKHWGWAENKLKYIFIITSALLLAIFRIPGIAMVIAWYVLLSAFTQQRGPKDGIS